jgi:hypothetical protein
MLASWHLHFAERLQVDEGGWWYLAASFCVAADVLSLACGAMAAFRRESSALKEIASA